MPRRTHKMIAANPKVTDNGVMTISTSIGPCCKLWFPLDETGSPAVFTDAVAGLTITATTQAQNEAGSWEITFHDADAGKAPTSGTVPTLSNNDFILFTPYKVKSAALRVLNLFELGDSDAGESISITDGDAFVIKTGGVTHASANNWGGAKTNDMKGGLALVKDGGKVGLWMYCPDGDQTIFYQGGTDSYTEYKDGDNVWCRRWDEATPSCQYPLGEPNQNIPNDNGDLAGHWKCYTAGALDLENLLRINTSGGIGQNQFTYALFQFENGLPSDWKLALRDMTDRFVDDIDKYIWPGWVSLD